MRLPQAVRSWEKRSGWTDHRADGANHRFTAALLAVAAQSEFFQAKNVSWVSWISWPSTEVFSARLEFQPRRELGAGGIEAGAVEGGEELYADLRVQAGEVAADLQ